MLLADPSSIAASRVDLSGFAGYKHTVALHLVNLVAEYDGMLVTLDRRLGQSVVGQDRRFVRVIE